MVFARLTRWTTSLLGTETRAGFITIAVALIATVWLNSPLGDSYTAFTHAVITIGPVTLDVHTWAADFLLAFFFFVVGIELRHELTSGSLRSPRAAIVPFAGAIGGIIVPALIFTTINAGSPTASGWAIPAATDIAFALAVLALIAPKASPALRAFLLTLAVVDDLGAILIIALAYSPSMNVSALVLGAVTIGVFAAVQRSRVAHPLLLGGLGFVAWYFVYSSGVHATVAGVALGLVLTPTARNGHSLAHRAMTFFHPFSSYVAVPLFVLVSAAVPLSVFTPDVVSAPLFLGIVLGFVIGKPLGILAFVWLSERFVGGQRDSSMTWRNVALVATVASIGFTVALLINDLAFTDQNLVSTGVAAIAVSAVFGGLSAVAVSRFPRR